MNQINELILKIFSKAKNNFFFILKNEKIILVSKNIEEILGFQENEILNKKIKDFFIDEDEYLKFIDYLKQISKDELTIRLKAKNKKEKFFEVLMTNFQEEDSSYLVILKDITEDKRREKFNKFLYKLLRKFFDIKNLQELLKEIHILLKEFTYAENFYVALMDESNDYIYFPYFVDLIDEKPEPRKRRGGITEYVLERKDGIILNKDEILKLRDEGKLIFYGTCPESYIGVPLKVKDKFIGVIAIQSYEKDISYDENDLDLLNFIADNVSLMIERLRDEETHLSLISNINGFVFQVIAETGKFLSIEGKFEEITGYKKEDFLEGRISFNDIIHKDDFNKLKEDFYNLIEGKVSSITNLYRIITKNGDIKWLSSSTRILFKEIPQTTIIQGLATDVTENIKLRDELFETEKKFKTLIDNSPIGITLTNKDGKIIYCNPEWEKIMGYKLEEMEKLTWMDLTYPEDLQEDLEKFKKLINGEIQSYSLEKRAIRKDGKIIWIHLKVVRVDDEKGNFLYEIAMVEDITEKKKLQETLIESEQRFRLFFEKNPLGVAIVDKNNNYIATNSHYRNLLGYSEEELLNLKWKDITYPEDYEKQNELFNKLINKEIDSFMIEKRYIRKDGSIFWGLLFASAAFDSKGEFLYSFGILRDITDDKKLREELEESRKKLSRALDNVLNLITKIIEMKDPFTLGHQGKVAILATKIAEKIKLPQDSIEVIRIAAMLHDIGKLTVPTEVLNKGGKLSENEYSLVKEHCKNGYEILKRVDFLYPIADIVLQHHERLDGSGYPLGLKNGEILLEARIIAVCDVFEAMISHRPYRPAIKVEDALKELKENKGILYEPEVVDILEEIVLNKEIDF